MQNTTAIVLSQSGAALVVRNEMPDSGSISVAYKISGAPTSLSVSVSGMKNSECELLDTYREFELPTLWFEARCSIQLSYGRLTVILQRI